MIKKLYLPLVALMVLALSSCGKMGELSSDYFTTNPEVLEAVAGKVPVTINGKFPEKYMKKNATVEVTPVIRWNGGEAKGQPAMFQGEKVEGNGQTISYKVGGNYTMKTSFKYVPEMQKSELYLTFDAKIGKKSVNVPAVKVANGVIATSELYKNTVKTTQACLAQDAFQRVTLQKQEANIKFLIQQAELRKSELKNKFTFKDKDEFVAIVDRLREQGVDMMFDIYNETLGVSVITVILPAWYQSMTAEEKKQPLTRLKLSVLVFASSLLLGFGFKDIQVAYIGPGYEKYEGKTVHEIAKEEGLSDLNAYLMLCEKSNFQGRVNMGPYTTPEIIHQFEHDPRCLYMTDAWVEDHGVQNPAIYDCFPKFLKLSLLGSGDTMPNTIRKMTGAVAERFSIKDIITGFTGFFKQEDLDKILEKSEEFNRKISNKYVIYFDPGVAK